MSGQGYIFNLPGLFWQPPTAPWRWPRIGGVQRWPQPHQVGVKHTLPLHHIIVMRGGGSVALRGCLCPVGGLALTQGLRQLRVVGVGAVVADGISLWVAGLVVYILGSVAPAAGSRRWWLSPLITITQPVT